MGPGRPIGRVADSCGWHREGHSTVRRSSKEQRSTFAVIVGDQRGIVPGLARPDGRGSDAMDRAGDPAGSDRRAARSPVRRWRAGWCGGGCGLTGPAGVPFRYPVSTSRSLSGGRDPASVPRGTCSSLSAFRGGSWRIGAGTDWAPDRGPIGTDPVGPRCRGRTLATPPLTRPIRSIALAWLVRPAGSRRRQR